jgi:hypothetical protein
MKIGQPKLSERKRQRGGLVVVPANVCPRVITERNPRVVGEQLEDGKILLFICNVVLEYKNAKTTLQEGVFGRMFGRNANRTYLANLTTPPGHWLSNLGSILSYRQLH